MISLSYLACSRAPLPPGTIKRSKGGQSAIGVRFGTLFSAIAQIGKHYEFEPVDERLGKEKFERGHPEGYMAVPATGGGPGVIVIHAWWGLTEFFRQTCDRLAEEGFLAYAPDLYSSATAKTIEQAERLSSKLDRKVADRKVVEAVDYLLSHPRLSSDRIGVIGFSLGAEFALTLACNRPDTVRAVVLFYGTGSGRFDKAKAAFMGHFAENDSYEPPEYVSSLEKSLVAAGRKVTFYTYAGKKHWFFEENVPGAYDSDAAKLAWERTVAFLRTQLS